MNPTSLHAATVLSNDWGWIRGPRISEGVILTVQGDTSLSRVQLFPTEWSVAHQAPLSMGFSRQAYWSGMPFLSPGDLLHSGIKSSSASCVGRWVLSH